MRETLLEKLILREQVKQLYDLAPFGFVGSVVNSIIVYAVLTGFAPFRPLSIWLGAVLAVTAARGVLLGWYKSVNAGTREPRVWRNRFLTGIIFTGAAWGSIAFLISSLSLAHQVFVAFVLGGMAAGASSTFSKIRAGFPAFTIPAIAPLVLHFMLQGDTFYRAMAAMTVLFLVLLWRISHHNYSVNRTSLLLRFENEEMIQSLKRANDEVKGLIAQLREEIDAKLEAEAELRKHHEHLEKMVQQRTADLEKANEQLSHAKEAAEAANLAKSEFLANMTHEMRTPLAGALGMIGLVLDMEIGAEERQLLEMAQRSAESLLRLIADLLDFARLEAGVMTFERKTFSVAETVRSAVEVISISAAHKGLQLSWKVDDAVREVVGDEGRLRQVLVNLLGNAVKFTQHGSIELSAVPDPGTKALVLFSVRDTGQGIPPSQLHHIFDKFTQVDASLSRQHGGTGLGLALSRQIVEKLGGSIWAESREGAGSVFYFTIPSAS